ncbi:hypothetical protein J2S17_004520 [Cytobacillus purgationiresistens]|uniref:Transposase n=1 Tax=Cytobacillus purgationiresistens TaxID=863449 RepID=A0ABU0AN05_9BACI|nr:hypothetical protein [Cytobacillus purgationiresistens]
MRDIIKIIGVEKYFKIVLTVLVNRCYYIKAVVDDGNLEKRN